MPAVASIESLQEVQKELTAIKKKHPEGYEAVANVIKSNKIIGYKNICKMMQGITPAELKEPKK